MYKTAIDNNGYVVGETELASSANENMADIDAIYPIGTPVNLVNEIYTIDPHPKDGKVYYRDEGLWIEDTTKHLNKVAKIDTNTGEVLEVGEPVPVSNDEAHIKRMITDGLIPMKPIIADNGDILNEGLHALIPGMVINIDDIASGKVSNDLIKAVANFDFEQVLTDIKALVNLPAEIQTLKSRIAELESVEVVTAIATPITVAGEYSLLVDGYANEYSQWSKWNNLHVYFSTNTMGVDHHIGTYSLADFATYDGTTNGWISNTNAKYIMHGEGGYVITRVPGNDFKLRVVMIGAGRIEKVKLSKR